MRLEGKSAVVTGGGNGIGRAISLMFAREGADVAIYDLNLDDANGVADEVRSLGRKALPVECDVSKKEEVTRATKEVLDAFGKIDILVNNAGITIAELTMNASEEMWNKTMDVNLKSQFLCCQAIGRHMIERKSGKIVNIASIQGHVSRPTLAVYAASKGGVLAFTRGLATELAAHNINVNAVCPSITDTGMLEAAKRNPKQLDDVIGRMPLRRINQPEDIAGAVLYLASDEARQVTGEYINVDTGTCALHAGYIWPKDWPNM
jgi:NAD(P)-dependent dehydrogenase (short-subunit alcohol dehydrogenase family)